MSGIRFIDEHPAELPRLIDEYPDCQVPSDQVANLPSTSVSRSVRRLRV
jgi:hypothetical protein